MCDSELMGVTNRGAGKAVNQANKGFSMMEKPFIYPQGRMPSAVNIT